MSNTPSKLAPRTCLTGRAWPAPPRISAGAFRNWTAGRLRQLALALLATACTPAHGADARFQDITIPDRSGKAVTVRGVISPGDLGVALMHEHLFIDFWLPEQEPERWAMLGLSPPGTEEELRDWRAPFDNSMRYQWLYRPWANRDAYSLDRMEDALAEIAHFRQLGGRTIVDVTSIGLNRRPESLVEASTRGNIHIVMGTGYYRQAWHPDYIRELNVDELTRVLVKELVVGIGDTGIRAGIIGEIPAEHISPLDGEEPGELKVLRASARASRLTGASISLHMAHTPPNQWTRVLDLLEAEGADLGRVVLGHARNNERELPLSFFYDLLNRGPCLEFDLLGLPQTEIYDINNLETIRDLIQAGYSSQVLVSHDLFSKFHLTKNGGYGLTFVSTVLVPYLRSKNVGEHQIQQILIDNPRRILTMEKPRQLQAPSR